VPKLRHGPTGGRKRAWLVGMVTIQPIEHDGHVVALVAGGRALLGDQLTGRTLALVRAKCLYALEVQAGERAGPYDEQAATRYAQRALAHRHQVRGRR
jgi:hypothetical protein